MRKHKHNLKISGWSGKTVEFRCDCGKIFRRNMDKSEIKKFRERESRHSSIHNVWHKMPLPPRWQRCRDQYQKLKMGEKIEKYSKKHPDGVVVLRCDDSVFASSDLVLIAHESERYWMGITVLMFPQCDGNEPSEFFLYPGHVERLIKALKAMHKRSKEKAKTESIDNKEYHKWWNSRANLHPLQEVK